MVGTAGGQGFSRQPQPSPSCSSNLSLWLAAAIPVPDVPSSRQSPGRGTHGHASPSIMHSPVPSLPTCRAPQPPTSAVVFTAYFTLLRSPSVLQLSDW